MIIHSDEYADLPAADGGVMRTHVFRPAIDGRYPRVVLYSEIYKVTDPIRRLAGFIAGHGYCVAVPEVYHEYEAPRTVLRYDPAGTDRGNELKSAKRLAAYDVDATTALDYLAAHPAPASRIPHPAGDGGVCLGGHLAYRAALDRRVSAAACL